MLIWPGSLVLNTSTSRFRWRRPRLTRELYPTYSEIERARVKDSPSCYSIRSFNIVRLLAITSLVRSLLSISSFPSGFPSIQVSLFFIDFLRFFPSYILFFVSLFVMYIFSCFFVSFPFFGFSVHIPHFLYTSEKFSI